MSSLLADPRLIDAILACLALEAIVLLWQRRWRLMPMLVSGTALLIALRAALAGGGGAAIGAALAVAGIAHAVDLWLRLHDRAG